MKIIVLSILTILMICSSLFAADTLWTKTYDFGDDDVISFIEPTNDGNFIFSGYITAPGANQSDIWIGKFDQYGDTIWTKIFASPSYDFGLPIIQTADNGYVFVGYWNSPVQNQSIFVKLDASGNIDWQKIIGNGVITERYRRVLEEDDGGFVTAGYQIDSDIYSSFILRYDQNGEVDMFHEPLMSYMIQWSNVRLIDMIQIQDKEFVTCGWTETGASAHDIWIARTDSNLVELWSKFYSPDTYCYPYSIQQTADDGFIMCGTLGDSYSSPETNVFLMKFNSLGDSLWLKSYGLSGNDGSWTVRVTNDGGFAIGGMKDSDNELDDGDFWFLKTDANGDTLWTWSMVKDLRNDIFGIVPVTDDEFILAGRTGFDLYNDLGDAWLAKISTGSMSCCNLRGDINNDSAIGISDLTYLVDYLFRNGPSADCEDEADLNNSGNVGISDLTYIVDYLFNNGPLPIPC